MTGVSSELNGAQSLAALEIFVFLHNFSEGVQVLSLLSVWLPLKFMSTRTNIVHALNRPDMYICKMYRTPSVTCKFVCH